MIDLPLVGNGDVFGHIPRDRPYMAAILDVFKKTWENKKSGESRTYWKILAEGMIGRFEFAMNRTSFTRCALQWSADEKKWIGRKINIWTERRNVFGEERYVIMFSPNQEKDAKTLKEW